jgi:hypothetical protein
MRPSSSLECVAQKVQVLPLMYGVPEVLCLNDQAARKMPARTASLATSATVNFASTTVDITVFRNQINK